jgi:tetratricopeptide (TPR) repeat protein
VKVVNGWVTNHKEQVVLLCDEPRSWGANRGGDDFFAQRSFDVAFFLAGLHCRRIIAGSLPVPIGPIDRVELSPPKVDPSWLGQAHAWGELASAAASIAESPLIRPSFTPLQIRLLVAAVALTSVTSVAQWLEQDTDGRHLVPHVAELMQKEEHRDLWDAWLRLSLTRRAFDQEVLEALTPTRVSARERDIIRHCLLYGETELRMHELLKLYAARWRNEHTDDRHVHKLLRRTNRQLFELHRKRFERLSVENAPPALRESMEAFHFASVTGDPALIAKVRPVFVEQLDALGWSLSYEHHAYAQAAAAFEQAIGWDDKDDYAHHYLAYNLDRIGDRVEDVEAHFRRAIEINGTHPWWRSRFIAFLLARGRVSESRREWEDALIELGIGEGDASAAIYEHLHCWVAGALLDSGEIRFAREVLEQVPDWARGQIEIYPALRLRTDALLQVGEGDAVVPAWRLEPNWWSSGPELLQSRLGTGEQLVRWLAGRVESKDQDGIHVRAAVVDDGETEPRVAWLEIQPDNFDDLSRDDISARDLPVGSFLEIGVYALPEKSKAALTLIRVLPTHRWPTAGLPSKRSDRYLTDSAESDLVET